ncbi:DUF4232 domain-containing protein [Streptomyces sp. SID5910]|uniref:DUF4232 domain-containing protein n=1 Tax=Streptomyces sp. SID5910 TaxID=2690312 RepID=UPI0013695112|nr:DUF4232 domain-containing protein [Streptomyces sp. SID5910]MYR43957.1 DUF4232 domain-containing protein [Streptomyces sp. SID5910]
MRVRKLTFAALAVAAGLSLTACNGDDGTAQDAAPSTAPSTSASSGGGAGSAGAGQDSAGNTSGSQGSEDSAEAGAGKCRTDELDITATDSTIDGDSEGSVAVTFTNGGGRDCTLSGYAGVDLKTNAGDLSAQRSGQTADPIVLKDGESVSFTVSYPVNDSGGSGVRVTALVVTPPNETKSVSVEWPGAATLPVTEGGGSPVRVGPMGSAGQGGQS